MGHQNARSFVSPWKSSFSFSSFKRKSSSRAAQAFRSSEDLKQIYNWHQNLEDLDQYEPGGLHPAQLGDRISQDRYEIIHKLGYGSYSTVWLAKDHSQYKESYVAIKILKSQAPFAEQEVKCWQHLQDGPAEHPGKRYILPLDDIFSIQGPNGRHLCLVMPVAGCDLYSCKISSSSMFRTDQGRAITARVLLGLSYIHSRGVVHGDLTMNNIFLRLGQLDAMTSNEIFQKFGHPKKESVMKMDGMPLVPSIPKYSIAPVETSITAATVTDTDLVISDFGAASMVSSMPSQIVTAAATRPPEAHLNLTRHSRFAGDIWSTACVAYNVLANGPLFRLVPFCQPEHESAQILQQISKLLGPPPDDMLTAWNSASEFSDGKKQLKEEAWGEQTPLREKMAGMRRLLGRPQYDFSIEEIGDLHDLLERMLKWRPCERISADEACQSKWMQQWGLPAIERTGG